MQSGQLHLPLDPNLDPIEPIRLPYPPLEQLEPVVEEIPLRFLLLFGIALYHLSSEL